MLTVTDSFVMFLHAGLAGTPPVKWVRQDQQDDTAHLMQHGAVNVFVLGADEQGSTEDMLISLDVLASSERDALTWLALLRTLLFEVMHTPELNYADPDTPVATGRMVFWWKEDVQFMKVAESERLVHYNCTMPLRHARG